MDEHVISFLQQLEKNNNRDWFNASKSAYESARKSVEQFIEHLIPELQKIDPKIGTLTAKECMFRIYRDVRFSKNKSPYKTHFGAYIGPGGRKSMKPGYYIHLEPGNSFIGGGSYRPAGEDLKKIRTEILYNLQEFEHIISNKQFKATFKTLTGDQLKRPPVGFPKDFEGIELLKFKDYIVMTYLDDGEILNPAFDQLVLNIFRTMKPLNDFLNRALEA